MYALEGEEAEHFMDRAFHAITMMLEQGTPHPVEDRKWYGKEMDERYPKFGMLGFDTGYFFLKGLSRYGSGFEKNLDKMDLVPIQTGFKFQPCK